jgi:hypothetical protein
MRAAQMQNIKLSEILKKGSLTVHHSAVLLMKREQVKIFVTEESGRNVYLFVANIFAKSPSSYFPFLELRQALGS